MGSLKGSETEANLRTALGRESEANRRYLWFAEQADIDGEPAVAELFRSLADAETGHAFGHLEYLVDLGDGNTGEPLRTAEDFLRSAHAAETTDATDLYPRFAAIARAEDLDEIASWFESLAKAEQIQADRLKQHIEGDETEGSDR